MSAAIRIVLLFVSMAVGCVVVAATPPNIILINVDDLGYADVGPYGGSYPTPQVDAMAREGRVFTSFYAAASVCTPSRAALMTGCYPARVDMLTNDLEMNSRNHGVLWPGDRKGLNPAEETIAEVLKARGYATGCVGKWHLGDQPIFLPTRQGFDEYFGIPFSNDMGTSIPFNVPLPLVRGERVIQELQDVDQEQLTKRYTEEAIDFIGRHAGKPFFLYLPHTMLHLPLYVSAAFKEKTGMGLFADALAEVDWSVGQILEKLKALRIAEKTLVIFTADNGRASPRSPFSGGKKTNAEGGFRVAMIAWWPGTITAGSKTDLMMTTLDLLPSFAALAGKPHVAAKERPIDGLDLSTLFRAQTPARSPRDTFAYFANSEKPETFGHTSLNAVREGRWKLFLRPQRVGSVAAGALFDVEGDPAERVEISAQHQEVVARLKGIAEKFATELGDENRPGRAVRKSGFVSVARPLNDTSAAPAPADVRPAEPKKKAGK